MEGGREGGQYLVLDVLVDESHLLRDEEVSLGRELALAEELHEGGGFQGGATVG